MADEPQKCALCGRSVRELTAHHLVPRSQHRRIAKRTGRTVEELRADTVDLCQPCHRMVHKTLTEKELASDWQSIDKLRQHPQLQTFVEWVSKQPDRRIIIR